MMDELQEIYDRITYLRKRRVKMKDMAERAGMMPSVFSALYSTVLPIYLKNRGKGFDQEQALDDALVWVNNVSKKKLLSTLKPLKETLMEIEAPPIESLMSPAGIPILSQLEQSSRQALRQAVNYCGIYLSYSVSSSKSAMKIEPYLIAPSENNSYLEVGHRSAYNNTHWGAAFMNGMNHLFLTFNECPFPQLALFHICLKLPMYDHPPFLRGIYTCFDYNYNPIARRILFVKVSDCTDRHTFLSMEGALKTENELSEEELPYYHYTCGKRDALRMYNILNPSMSVSDLEEEKKLME